MGPKAWKEWTIKEEKYLIENHMLSLELLGHKLNRTKNSVRARIKKLKLEGRIKELKQKAREAHEIFQWEKRNPEAR